MYQVNRRLEPYQKLRQPVTWSFRTRSAVTVVGRQRRLSRIADVEGLLEERKEFARAFIVGVKVRPEEGRRDVGMKGSRRP
jgi:hypothetical protein